jgi:hypothetical protein
MRPAGLGQWPSLLAVDDPCLSPRLLRTFRRIFGGWMNIVRREQYCFKSPELTSTNIRVQIFFFLPILPVREDRLCTWKRYVEARSRSPCCGGKAVRFTCFACVFAALVIQLVKRMRHVVACVALPGFSTLSHTGGILGRKLLNVNCVFWFSLQILFETFPILRGVKWDVINVRSLDENSRYSCRASVKLDCFENLVRKFKFH